MSSGDWAAPPHRRAGVGRCGARGEALADQGGSAGPVAACHTRPTMNLGSRVE
jgi:hypothetical protein